MTLHRWCAKIDVIKKLQRNVMQRILEELSMRMYKQHTAEFVMALLLDGFQEDGTPGREEELRKNAVLCGLFNEDGDGTLKYAVIVTRIETPQNRNQTAKNSLNIINSVSSKYMECSSVCVQGRVISLLMAAERGFEKYLHILAEDIWQSVEHFAGGRCTIGVSRITDHLTGCHECYVEAMNALGYAKRNAGGVHFISEKERIEEIDQDTLQKILGDVETMLRGCGTEKEMDAYLENIFLNSESGKLNWSAKSFLLLQISFTALQALASVAGNKAVQNVQQKYPLNQLIAASDSKQMLSICQNICCSVMRLTAEHRKHNSEIFCERALCIIQERYMDPELSLVEVSREIAVSPNYLSALIKKNTGSTFRYLLTKKRIETAQEMLSSTSMKIREITEKCGYRDQHYFSYCFKKNTGISPNQSRGVQVGPRASG